MGNKTGLEYDIRHVETNVHIGYQDAWCCATERIGKLCADMNDGGWTLSTMSWPSLSRAVLVFTRPKRLIKENAMQTLVVVDMQPRRFEAARTDWMIKNVGREVRVAMEAMHTIIFLEYIIGTSVGVSVKDMTDSRLTNIVVGYDAAVVARKAISDGSEQVCAVLEEMGLAGGFAGRTNEIRVVGVETGVCLADTVNGLAEKMPGTRVIVVGDACNAAGGTFPEPHDRGQEQIKTGANVEILKAVGPLACGRPVS